MALEVVGGTIFSGFIHQVFQKMDCEEVKNLIKGRKQTDVLLKKLRIAFISVNAVFNDAEEKQIIDLDAKQRLHELKEAILDAKDLLEEIKTEALRHKMEDEYGNSTNKVQQLLQVISASFHAFDESIDSKIEEILERLGFNGDKKNVFNLKTKGRHKILETLPSTSLVKGSDVYERHEDKETLIKLLLSDDETDSKIGVIPIVGMGGIGKTTLAQLLINDDRVKKHFEIRAWVCVSDELDLVRMIQTIHQSVTFQTCDSTELSMLQVKLEAALKGKKFHFVHDDVWNENYNHWDFLRGPFESGAHGSKIIVTTCSEGVASMVGTLRTQHLMQIPDEDCWLLFSKHAFENASASANANLEVIGRQIVGKCKGLPLAAKLLGGLLRSMSNLEEWENVLNSDLWELSDTKSNILPALWLSYQYLPPCLKGCFAYCSIFPKDYVFCKSKLVLMWMAEDLLQPKKNQTIEEVGESYFDHLISRSFFQPSSSDGNYFKMHDLINDLSKFVSEQFCVRLEDNDSMVNVSKARHFAYMKSYGVNVEKYDRLYEAKYLRTFLLEFTYKLPKVRLDRLLMLRCLRVLKLKNSPMEKLPNSISNLKHLRYLDLPHSRHLRHLDMSHMSIEKIPDTVCSLYNLQTLLLSWCRALAELPTQFERLINLRHLDINGTRIKKMPPHMGKLKDLQTIKPAFFLDNHTGDNIVELKGFEHLSGTLCIPGLQNIVSAHDALEAKMREKKHLSELILEWEGETEDSQKDIEVLDNLQPHTNLKELVIKCYGGITFPGWLGDGILSNLVSLRLQDCGYCLSMPALGQLPSLKKLDISGLNGVKLVSSDFYGGPMPAFRSLEHLGFFHMREWQEWSYIGDNKAEGGAFLNLRVLRVWDCLNLTGILPLDNFLNLEELELRDLNIESLILSQESNNCPKLLSLIWVSIFECPNVECFSGGGGFHAPNLKGILVHQCRRLRSLPKASPLPSLQSISMVDCPELESFWEAKLLSQLVSLEIRCCKKIFANSTQQGLQALTSLRCLTIDCRDCEEIVESFPDKGLLPTNLTYLHISGLLNLKRIDGKELRQLTSLTYLSIWGCPELRSLPDEGLPTSLCLLDIRACPLRLQLRCDREKGEDWPKLAHIPRIVIDGRRI